MTRYVVIVAGGSGRRMKSVIPKQFLLLKGKPVLMQTINRFKKAIPGCFFVIVLADKFHKNFDSLCKKHKMNFNYKLINGGKTRFDSVKNGLEIVPEDCLVAVHDAVRPLVSSDTIRCVFNEAKKKGNAVPVVEVNETLREITKKGNKIANRSNFQIVQTPQCFDSTVLKQAFTQPYRPSFTDEASVADAIGVKINLVKGNTENIKITTPDQLKIAEVLFSSVS